MMATYLFVCVLLSKISVYQKQYEDMNMVLQQLSVRPDQSVLKGQLQRILNFDFYV